MPPIRMNLMLWNLYIAELLSSAEAPAGYPSKYSNTSCRPRFLFLSPSLPATKRGPCGRERGIYKLPCDLRSVHVRKSVKLDPLKWRIQRRGPGPSLFLDQTEARRAENIFLGRPPPPPLSPPSLKV